MPRKSNVSVPNKTSQSLSKDEKKAKEFIELGFRPHEGPWMETSKRLLDAYNGKYYSKTTKSQRFVVNTIFSLVNLLLPNLIFNRPYLRAAAKQAKYFKVLPDKTKIQIDNNHAAEIREAALNHKYQQIRAIVEQRAATQDAFFYGFGITKVGYSYETITSYDKDYVVKDSPFLKRVSPKDFGWHPCATGLDDSPKLVHRTMTSLYKLKESGRYKDSVIDKIEPEVPEWMQKKMNRYGGQTKGKSDHVSLYEVHCQEEDKIYTFAGESHILIDKMNNPYDFAGPHFSLIRFASDNENFEGIPFMAMIEDEALALNEIVTLIVEHFRKFPGLVWYNTGSIDDADVDRIKNGEQGSMHAIPDINSIKFQNPLSMGSEYFSIVELMQNLIEKVLGVSDFQRLGQGGSTRRSATEATFIQGDATIRRQYYLNIVKEFIVDGVEKIAGLQAQFQDEKEEICASGDMKGIPIEYDKSDIQGKFAFDFDVDELLPYNEAQSANMNALLTTLSSQPVLQPLLQTIDPQKMAKVLFRAVGRNLESIQRGDIETAVFPDPEVENKMAREGKPMPAPKKGEDVEKHVRVHQEDLIKNGPNDQILEHLAETIIMSSQAAPPGLTPAPAGAPAEGAGAAPVGQVDAMQPAGPPGPGQEVS